MLRDEDRSAVEEAWLRLLDDTDPGANRRRLLPELQAHDLWLIVDRPGNHLSAELTLAGPFGEGWREARDLAGVGVVVTPLSPSRAQMTLTENRTGQSSLFRSLVTDLVVQIDPTGAGRSLDRILVRLEVWRRFFASRANGLSAESQLGLYGELLVLLEVVAPAVGPETACRTWTGPDPAVQDFQLPGGSIEVKTTRGAGPLWIAISSERQLDTTGSGELLLIVNELDARDDGPGETLPALVARCRELASASPLGSLALEDSLLAAGYLDSDAVRYPMHYCPRGRRVFRVAEGFPRIVPSMLPAGVGSVRYALAADACTPWQVGRQEATTLLANYAESAQWWDAREQLTLTTNSAVGGEPSEDPTPGDEPTRDGSA